MASRTKSFFAQDHARKSKPQQWHRHSNTRPALSEVNNINAPPKRPIPPTSQTKSKLQAFQFVQAEPQRTSEESTEEGLRVDEAVEATRDSTEAKGDQSNTTPALPHANTFPSTPAGRISLEDLIGNFDEAAKKPEPRARSPEETIGWIPNSSSTLLTPNRKRKRARSSSPSCPTTSSQRQSACFLGNGSQATNITPEADPTADLWKRYGSGNAAGEGLKLPDFSHLFSQASPGPLETPAKNSGLRRWASTGNNWPSSKSKRPRTGGKTSVNLRQQEKVEQVESCGKSKVAAMVEKIQESLATQRLEQAKAKPKVAVHEPSSSSPLPEKGGESLSGLPAAGPSPVKKLVSPPQKLVASQDPDADAFETMIDRGAPTATLVSRGASQIISKPVQLLRPGPDQADTAPLHLHSRKPMPAFKRPSITRISSTGPQKPAPVPAPGPVLPAVQEALDEFGDDDFDMTAEDLEDIASQVPLEKRPLHAIPPHPNPPPQLIGLSSQAAVNAADNDDEFGDDDLDEDSLMIAESPHRRSPHKVRSPRKPQSPQKQSQPSANNEQRQMPSSLQRFVVKQVVEGEYTSDRGRRSLEKVMLVQDDRTGRPVSITLRGSWENTTTSAGDVVHVGALHSSPTVPSTPGEQIFIDDSGHSPFLIVHPDHMLSATTVADSFDCNRKAVLQDRIKATGETSKPMVYGKILHEIFQQALSANKWSDAFLAELVDKTVQAHVEGLWDLGIRDTVLAVEEVRAKMGELASWAKVFVAAEPSELATVDDKQGEKVWVSISKLIAIEEHIWSPQYGLKGNIDATVQTTLVDHPRKAFSKLVVPFEVKTGRTTQSAAHQAQTALYTLLLSDRYGVSVTSGLLYYLQSSSMSRIAPPPNEVRQMVQQRNRLAAYLHRAKHPPRARQTEETERAQPAQAIEDSGLPTMLRNPFKCGRCYAQQSCFTFHALVENGSADSAGMVDDGKKNHSLVWQEAVGHLATSANDQTQARVLREWFTKWDRLLTFEEGDFVRYKKELWTMSSAQREEAGRCFGNLVITEDLTSTAAAVTQSAVDGIEGGGGKINRFAYSFARAEPAAASFAEGSQLTVGEPVVVSSEQGQWALANGYVVGVSKHKITLAVDRKLGDARQRMQDFDEERNQAFQGIMTVQDADRAAAVQAATPLRYRLDKDDFSNGLALVRNNLVALMSSHSVHTKLRNQIIFNAQPTFAATSTAPALQPSQLGDMNDDQRAAVSKVLSAQDYALILGMPGTGKTTTIAHIIRGLLAEGKSILLTSFTHTAVDNIILRLRGIAPPDSILRMGVPAKINPQVQEFCQLAATPRRSIEEIEQAYMGCKIVATTCMGTNHVLFNRRAFDVCIVDEASQITLPTSLGPLLHARKFVLVGDHYQLPPLVQNRAALEGGLDVSLFRQLSERCPETVATLGRQYRMCEEVMSLSNALIYSGQLRCGNESVAQRTLHLPIVDGLTVFHAPSERLQSWHDPPASKPGYVDDSLTNSGLQAFNNKSNSCEPACSPPEACWLKAVTSPANKVVFANTDNIGTSAVETLTSGKNITNLMEATLTAQIVKSLLALGVDGKDIGVITLYRSQLALLRRLFKAAGIGGDVDIDSADRFQGRDKECIILSMVRSNSAGIVGDLLKDWRRVNVALTRARSKLVVLGSRQTLRHNELLATFLDLVDGQGWALELPREAAAAHTFTFGSRLTGDLLEQSWPTAAEKAGRRSDEAKGQASSRWGKQVSSRGRKQASSSARKGLVECLGAANRRPATHLGQTGVAGKRAGKVIRGVKGRGGLMAKFDILEDLTAEET